MQVLTSIVEKGLPSSTDPGSFAGTLEASDVAQAGYNALVSQAAWTLGVFASSCSRHAKAVLLEGGRLETSED